MERTVIDPLTESTKLRLIRPKKKKRTKSVMKSPSKSDTIINIKMGKAPQVICVREGLVREGSRDTYYSSSRPQSDLLSPKATQESCVSTFKENKPKFLIKPKRKKSLKKPQQSISYR